MFLSAKTNANASCGLHFPPKDSNGNCGFLFKNLVISNIIKDSSAARNGLTIDHNILEVDGQNVIGLKVRAQVWILLPRAKGPLTIAPLLHTACYSIAPSPGQGSSRDYSPRGCSGNIHHHAKCHLQANGEEFVVRHEEEHGTRYPS